MVVTYNFQDIYEASAKISTFNLPQHKASAFKIEFETCTDNETQYNGSKPPLPFACSDIFYTSIVDWKCLTTVSKECKTIYEVTFDIKGTNLNFKPGDTIGIIPQNITTEVDFIINHLNLKAIADSYYTLCIDSGQKKKLPSHIPVVSTVRHVLTHCVDFRSVAKKLFILALARYTKDEAERKVLEYLSSKEGATAYTTHILNENTCLLDLLVNFKTCKPPVEILFQHLPRLLPRPYSIVNSPHKEPDVLKICFSVMNIDHNRKGLTTGWIESIILRPNLSLEDSIKSLSLTDCNKVPIYLRNNMNCFELPEKVDTPLILIGPGTGVAPFIGFLGEIEYLRHNNCHNSHPIWLFFGCRNPELDFIYQKELKDFVQREVLTCLKTAYSRYDNYVPKYVQDAILENGEDFVKLIKQGGKIYVCGDLKTMAKQVEDSIVKCLVKYDDKDTDAAEKFICDMQKKKSYIVDIWN